MWILAENTVAGACSVTRPASTLLIRGCRRYGRDDVHSGGSHFRNCQHDGQRRRSSRHDRRLPRRVALCYRHVEIVRPFRRTETILTQIDSLSATVGTASRTVWEERSVATLD